MSWKLTHPIVYPTVDCAIFENSTLEHIYLAKKPNRDGWRFVGGFVDPRDESYSAAAIREAKEETGLDCNILDFVISAKVEDPRYAKSEDKIVTSLFAMVPKSGNMSPRAMDDISEIGKFRFEELRENMFVEEHRNLFAMLGGWRIVKRWNDLASMVEEVFDK